MFLLPRADKTVFQGVEPEIFAEDELELRPYGIAGKVISAPGHTPGSRSIFIDRGEAIIGDLVMGSLMIDRTPATAFRAGDEARSRASIARVLGSGPTLIRSTPGGPFTPGQLARPDDRRADSRRLRETTKGANHGV